MGLFGFGKKKSLLVFIGGFVRNAIIQVGHKGFGDFFRKVQNNAVSALSRNDEGIVGEIHVVDVQSHAFAYSYARAEKEGNYCRIPEFVFVVKSFLMASHSSTRFHRFEQIGNFVALKSDYFFFVYFGSLDFSRRVMGNIVVFIQKVH